MFCSQRELITLHFCGNPAQFCQMRFDCKRHRLADTVDELAKEKNPMLLPYCQDTVKTLKFGTPQTIGIIVLKIEKFDVTLHLCIQKMLMEWQTA